MAGIVSVSRTDLAQRRKKLRNQRRIKILQTIWRTLAISGLAGGLLWVAIQPMWVLQTPAQIVMKSGNQFLSESEIKSLLSLSYPQSLWKVKPAAIAQSLKQHPTIAQATVNRRLFPPGLIVEIKERVPVAVAQTSQEQRLNNCLTKYLTSGTSTGEQLQKCLQNSGLGSKQASVGLLDVSGVWMPLDKYISLNPTSKLPNLKVIGSPEQYQSYWPKLYQAVSHSSIKVLEIDCQNSTNLILKTEIGKVHLGVPGDQLPEQINVLSKIRHLPTKVKLSQMEYIDLKNPDVPIVQMNDKNPQPTVKPPVKKS
ncbi:MAG TPA: FtsQ-type POTRA domain-containing protein [Nostocaceae cyanobacterium]|nr:FtsQ-type POTRA domain-containing protein [Nostocaceae cyanobacterium]